MPTRITPTGVVASSLPEAQAAIFDLLRAVFGNDLALEAQTPQAQVGSIIALYDTESGEVFVALENANDLDSAVGNQLDSLGSLLLIERRDPTRSRVTATLAGVAGVSVAAGARARTTEGAEFRTQAVAVLSPSGVDVEMEASTEGPVSAAPGSLTAIVTVTPGWESITNAAAATEGRDAEPDGSYRESYRARVARNAQGPLDAYRAALADVLTTRRRVVENRSSTAAEVIGEWSVAPSAVLAVAEGGTDADVTRAIENHRGGGAPTMTGILGGAPDEAALALISDGTITWDGTAFTGLDLTATSTATERATALTTLLDGTGVVARAVDNRYLVSFPWFPNFEPNFGTGTTEAAFGLDADSNTYPAGPFIRPRDRVLSVVVELTRGDRFPADGLAQVRDGLLARVAGYDLGETLYRNDLLVVTEAIPGTVVTTLSVRHNTLDVNGGDIPLDARWTLALGDLSITVT